MKKKSHEDEIRMAKNFLCHSNAFDSMTDKGHDKIRLAKIFFLRKSVGKTVKMAYWKNNKNWRKKCFLSFRKLFIAENILVFRDRPFYIWKIMRWKIIERTFLCVWIDANWYSEHKRQFIIVRLLALIQRHHLCRMFVWNQDSVAQHEL